SAAPSMIASRHPAGVSPGSSSIGRGYGRGEPRCSARSRMGDLRAPLLQLLELRGSLEERPPEFPPLLVGDRDLHDDPPPVMASVMAAGRKNPMPSSAMTGGGRNFVRSYGMSAGFRTPCT